MSERVSSALPPCHSSAGSRSICSFAFPISATSLCATEAALCGPAHGSAEKSCVQSAWSSCRAPECWGKVALYISIRLVVCGAVKQPAPGLVDEEVHRLYQTHRLQTLQFSTSVSDCMMSLGIRAQSRTETRAAVRAGWFVGVQP